MYMSLQEKLLIVQYSHLSHSVCTVLVFMCVLPDWVSKADELATVIHLGSC